jgi:Glycine zipper 2TM domain
MKKMILASLAVASLGFAAPVMAAELPAVQSPFAAAQIAPAAPSLEQSSEYRGKKYRRGYRQGYRDASNGRGYYDGPVWRGNDGRYRCRRDNGTTGLLIGGATGALIGNEVAGRGDKLLGTIIGGAAGALLGREIDKSRGFKCR